MKKQILRFKKDDLKSVNFFATGLQFPIAIAIYSDWEEQQLSYMCKNYIDIKMDTEDICKWCIRHRVAYQIMYPMTLKEVLNNPSKYCEYRKMKRRLRRD